jgi:Protein of unknown function (DUF1214)
MADDASRQRRRPYPNREFYLDHMGAAVHESKQVRGWKVRFRGRFQAKMVAGLLFAATVAGSCVAADVSANPLATADQKAFDQQALRILASPAVQQQRKVIEEAFSADPWAATPEGQATLPASLNEVLFSGVVGALNADPFRPKVEWLWSPAHSWFGLDVPAAKFIMPNVDNVFRVIPVDSVSHYEITARPGGGRIPTQWTLQLIRSVPTVANAESVFAVLMDTDIHAESDGSFTLTVGPEPANGQANYLQTVPNAGLLLIRDTIADWQTETPYHLSVKRVEGPASSAAQTDFALAERASQLVKEEVPLIVKAKANSFFHPPANTLPSPKVREGGRWGLSAAGHFKLSDDEALVVTLDTIGAQYLSIQLANAWLGSLDYIHHSASLNKAQADANADGSYTVVIAPHDPGVHNWLDTTQLHEGSFFVRWQKLPQPLGLADGAVRDIKLLKIFDLAAALPHGTRRVSPDERRKLLADRAEAYGRRFDDRQ